MRQTPMLTTTTLRALLSGLWLLLAGLALLLTGRVAYADHGPKPSQDFQFVYQTGPTHPNLGRAIAGLR